MKAWIKADDLGYFVGELFGLGFFQDTEDIRGTENDAPVEFDSVEEAQAYLDSWVGGAAGCYVTTEPPETR